MKLIATAILLAALSGCEWGGYNGPVQSSTSSTTGPATAPASKPDQPTTTRGILGLPAGWELMPSATYTARQSGGDVTIKAAGQHNTGGFETKMFQSPLRIYPPQWMLAHKPPPADAMVTQAITPFEVTASFRARQPVKQVVVNDVAGRHEVNVSQGEE